MSLINDALKRAKQAQQKQTLPAPGTPMRPMVATRPTGVSRSLVLPIFVAAALLLVVGILILFAVSRVFDRTPVPEQPVAANPPATISLPSNSAASLPNPPLPSIMSNVPTPVLVAPPVQSPPLQTPAAEVARPVAPAVVAVETSDPATAVRSNLVPSLPKLQGIVFNPARPTAFLNGKSVVVGGRVGEFTVVAITKQAVTIERAGQTNVLSMEE